MQAVGAGAVAGRGNTYTPNVNQGRGASHVAGHERSKGKPAQHDPVKVQATKERADRISNAVMGNLKSAAAYASSKVSVQNKVAGAIQKKADQLLKISKEIEKAAPKIANKVGNAKKTISKALGETPKIAVKLGNEARKATRDAIKKLGKNTGKLGKVIDAGGYLTKNVMKAAAPIAGTAMNIDTIRKNESNFKSMLAATDLAGDRTAVLAPITSTANLVGSVVYDALPQKGKDALDKAYDPYRKIPQHLIDIRTHNIKSTPHERSRRNKINTNTQKNSNLKKKSSSNSNAVVKTASKAPQRSTKSTSRNIVVKTNSTKRKTNPHTTSHIAASSSTSTNPSRRTSVKKSSSRRVVSASKRKVSSKSSAKSKSSSHSSSSKKKSSGRSSKKSSSRTSSSRSSRSSSKKSSSRSSSRRRSSRSRRRR